MFHTGAFDGFSTLIAFFPDHDLGLVAVNAMDPSADLWTIYTLALLLSQRLGGNPDLPQQVVRRTRIGWRTSPISADSRGP